MHVPRPLEEERGVHTHHAHVAQIHAVVHGVEVPVDKVSGG